jgi:hypothetical protein
MGTVFLPTIHDTFRKLKVGDSKMAARGRNQKTCFLNLGEMLEIHITGKTTKKRQNFDSSTPPAHA